jgi:hypothetical protein
LGSGSSIAEDHLLFDGPPSSNGPFAGCYSLIHNTRSTLPNAINVNIGFECPSGTASGAKATTKFSLVADDGSDQNLSCWIAIINTGPKVFCAKSSQTAQQCATNMWTSQNTQPNAGPPAVVQAKFVFTPN